MKGMSGEMQAFVKSLKAFTKKMESMAKKIEKLEKQQGASAPKKAAAARAPKKMPGRKAGKPTAIDTVLKVIGGSKKGVSTGMIKKKTGFDEKKIWNIINRLKQKGSIKSEKKGLYIQI